MYDGHKVSMYCAQVAHCTFAQSVKRPDCQLVSVKRRSRRQELHLSFLILVFNNLPNSVTKILIF